MPPTSTRLPSLVRHLQAAGQITHEIADRSGARILLLENGARVLGLYPPDDDTNFLWTHPTLATSYGARELFSSGGWPNPGGDRTWLAPEHALFFGNETPTWEHYRVPAGLDPGVFKLQRTRAGARFTGRARLLVRGSRRPAEARIRKAITPAANPLANSALAAQVRYAGYTTSTTLATKSSTALALWQLLQLPHGGEMLVQTLGRATPRVLFGEVKRQDWIARRGLLRHTMNAKGNHKLGLPAAFCSGLAGYVYPSARGEHALVVRQWTVNPKKHYVDTPWNEPGTPGDCFQLCNVNSKIGRFSELEHHAPAGDGGDVSHVWAFRGSRGAILEVARVLLGIGRAS